MSGLFKSKTKSTSSTTANPLTTALFNPTYQQAQGLINRPFTPYTGQLSAPMSELQQQSIGGFQAGQGREATQTAI